MSSFSMTAHQLASLLLLSRLSITSVYVHLFPFDYLERGGSGGDVWDSAGGVGNLDIEMALYGEVLTVYCNTGLDRWS